MKRRRTIVLFVLFGAAAIALIAWLLWPRPPLAIAPDPFVVPVPSASASAGPDKLDQALPPPDDNRTKPR